MDHPLKSKNEIYRKLLNHLTEKHTLQFNDPCTNYAIILLILPAYK